MLYHIYPKQNKTTASNVSGGILQAWLNSEVSPTAEECLPHGSGHSCWQAHRRGEKRCRVCSEQRPFLKPQAFFFFNLILGTKIKASLE